MQLQHSAIAGTTRLAYKESYQEHYKEAINSGTAIRSTSIDFYDKFAFKENINTMVSTMQSSDGRNDGIKNGFIPGFTFVLLVNSGLEHPKKRDPR
jgi:hypothetical protein